MTISVLGAHGRCIDDAYVAAGLCSYSCCHDPVTTLAHFRNRKHSMREHRVPLGEPREILKSAERNARAQAAPAILPAGISVSGVEAELQQIIASKAFAQGERLRRFLEFTVTWALAERSEQLKEYVLAVEVYGRKDSFDPKENSIVRVEDGPFRRGFGDYRVLWICGSSDPED